MNRKEIDKISSDLVGYIHPEYFKEEVKNSISFGKNFDKNKVKNYFQVIASIRWCLQKVSRYETYFLEFYPESKNVKKHEALEHHVHAYLEDVETLKNKLTNYLGCLKNDLKKVATNKKEISEAIDWLTKQVYKVFKQASDLRADHRHKGYRFVDTNILDVEMAETMLSVTNPLKNHLTPYALEHFEKQKNESFEKGKMFWIKTAKHNLSQVEGAVDETLSKTKSFLYTLLDISEIDFMK